MRKTEKIFSKNPKSDHLNKENFPSFSLSLEDSYLQCLMVNTIENTYYANKKDLLDQALDIHKNFLKKTQNHERAAKAIIYARNKGCMRLQPILGLAFLSTLEDKKYFKSAFHKVIRTPNDLVSFIDICRSGKIRKGIGRSIKKQIIKWLQNNTSEYWAIKYKDELVDAIRVSRPSEKAFDATPTQKKILKYLMEDKIDTGLKQIKAYHDLKKNLDNEEKILKLIGKGSLPHEAVVGALKETTPAVWKALAKQNPYFATLRMLNTFKRNGLFSGDKEFTNYIAGRLSDAEALKKSKVLPFRLLTAYKFGDDLPTAIYDALRVATDNSFINMPDLPGRVAIGVDVSGSMSNPMGNGKVTCKDIASVFGAALLKKSSDNILLPVDTELHAHTCSAKDSMLTNAEKMAALGGGGTHLYMVPEHLTKNNEMVDTIIMITDSEEFNSDGCWGNKKDESFLSALKQYRKKINPKLKVFYVRLAPHDDSMSPPNEPSIYQISGWSNNVLDYITFQLKEKKSQWDEIAEIELTDETYLEHSKKKSTKTKLVPKTKKKKAKKKTKGKK